jgi:hypothetical protein
MASEAPPPPLPSLSTSPRSPVRKRRPGVHSARAVAALGAAPAIPPSFAAPFFSQAVGSQSLQALHAYQCTIDRRHALSNVISLILDTGASISVTNCIADFIAPLRPVQHTTLQGIAAGLEIKGLGTVRYSVLNDVGQTVTITIPEVLFVPECPSRLICPRQLLLSTGGATATLQVQASGM